MLKNVGSGRRGQAKKGKMKIEKRRREKGRM
jgi:hypothetical protein